VSKLSRSDVGFMAFRQIICYHKTSRLQAFTFDRNGKLT